jgi:hypothetical protein
LEKIIINDLKNQKKKKEKKEICEAVLVTTDPLFKAYFILANIY